jgi:hypothetical protein
MTLKIFSQIQIIINEIVSKIKKDLHIKIDKRTIKETCYDIYLTIHGFRNGTFIEFINTYQNKLEFNKINKINYDTYDDFFENKYFVMYINKLFAKLFKQFKNIKLYVGALYDSSYHKDTIYIYNTKNEPKIMKSINYIEKRVYKISKKKMTTKIRTKAQKHIAKLLSYDIINYNDFQNGDKNLIGVDFGLTDKSKMGIFGYYTYKQKIPAAEKRLKKLNTILKPLHKSCKLFIDNEI